MGALLLLVNAAAIALPVPMSAIIIAFIILAIILAAGSVWLFRSGNRKKGAKAAAPGGNSDWQRQAPQQQGAPGAWNQQPGAAGQGSWGQQMQQPGGWNAPADGGAAGGWGTPAQQQPAANQWNAPAQQQQAASQWGAPASQPSQPSQGQQPQTAYGGGSNSSGPAWGQSFNNPQQDAWSNAPASPANQWNGSPAPANAAAGAAPWQQPGGGLGQNNSGMDANTVFANNEADKTVLRTTGPQGALGIVRVEEGKEPGRIYEVRKESLSIGRSRESDIFLEDLAVSRLHASIVNMGNGNYALKDEGSANGTKVNGQLVNKYQTYPLQEGDS